MRLNKTEKAKISKLQVISTTKGIQLMFTEKRLDGISKKKKKTKLDTSTLTERSDLSRNVHNYKL